MLAHEQLEHFLFSFSRMWFNVGAGLITVTLAIAAFLIVWLSMVKKVSSDDWESTYPAAIPIATASFIAGSCWLVVYK